MEAVRLEQAREFCLRVLAVVPAVCAIARIGVVNILSSDYLANVIQPRDVWRRQHQHPVGLQHSSNLHESMHRVGKKMLYDFAEENSVERFVVVRKFVLFDIELLVCIFDHFASLMNRDFLFSFTRRMIEEISQVKSRVSEFGKQRRHEIRIRAEFENGLPGTLRHETERIDT